MVIKALKPFAGIITMAPGDVEDVDTKVAADLIRCGYAEEVIEEKKAVRKKAVVKDEDK